MSNQFDINNIPAEKFEFAQAGKNLRDEKFKHKPIGYFEDAWMRFKKNKASLTATIISRAILVKVLARFASAAPLVFCILCHLECPDILTAPLVLLYNTFSAYILAQYGYFYKG